jgi:RNA polymerase sigma-70 factor
MELRPNLTQVFLEHAPAHAVAPADMAAVETQLHGAWEAGRAPWPGVDLPADAFVRHLAERLPRDGVASPLALLLGQLALSDFYLACACVRGVPEAVEMLERHYLARLPALMGHLKVPGLVLDDVLQWVRIHLLMGTTGAGPQLAEYTGRGGLLSWIRVIATRGALRQGAPLRTTPTENVIVALEALPAEEPSVDLELFKRRYSREFRQAMYESFAALSSEQRYHLRLHFVERLSTTEMGALFRVNQSTVSRWLKSARRAVYEETKRRLRERLGLSSREFTSLVAAIESQVDLSLSQVFTEEG